MKLSLGPRHQQDGGQDELDFAGQLLLPLGGKYVSYSQHKPRTTTHNTREVAAQSMI